MRLFVAVDVGDELRAEAVRAREAIESELRKTCRELPRIIWVAPTALHLTLRFLGEVDERDLPNVERALAPPLEATPFDVEWRGLGVFPGPRDPRALWIGVVRGADRLGVLQSEVFQRLSKPGCASPEAEPFLRALGEEARPFRPHVTLGRVKSRGEGADWKGTIEAAEIRGARSRVDHVTLFRSTPGPRGPAYTAIVMAPLTGGR